MEQAHQRTYSCHTDLGFLVPYIVHKVNHGVLRFIHLFPLTTSILSTGGGDNKRRKAEEEQEEEAGEKETEEDAEVEKADDSDSDRDDKSEDEAEEDQEQIDDGKHDQGKDETEGAPFLEAVHRSKTMKPDDFRRWLVATNRSAPEYEELKAQIETVYGENAEEESAFEEDPDQKDETDEDENKGGNTQKDTSDEESEESSNKEKETTDGVAGDDRAHGHYPAGRRHEVEIHNNNVPIKRFGNGVIYQLDYPEYGQAPQEQQGDGQKDQETHEDRMLRRKEKIRR